MIRLKSLPENAMVYDVFQSRPKTFDPFTQACEQIMRADSALPADTRELLGSFVSKLNACPYCHDVHNEAVKAHGLDGTLTASLVEDIDAAPIDARLKPLFKLAEKMTRHAYKVTQADFDHCTEAGLSDDEIQDGIYVTCLFNFMNRLVSTLGIESNEDYLALAGTRIRDTGYAGTLAELQDTN